MSKTIDERVVSMQFDNRNFEANVKTSLSTLDKLKQNKFSPKSKEEMLDLYKFLEVGDNNENR